ncbi:MAG: HEAT repeat domain-containing protein [Treponema sp.]|jgi:HEAT repeat protein|nr:HEAT repeat domain-containing protein [Treponema sp.]
MLNLKCPAVFSLLFLAVTLTVSGQSTGSGREMSVEEFYLQETNEITIIREQLRSNSEEQKLLALEFIKDAMNRGNNGEDIRASLEYLATEGTVIITRENGRLVNNHPLVRKQAVEYLGDLGTAEAKDTLIRILRADNESMVLAEAFKSLARIGINENDQTVNEITTVVRHYNALASSKPDEYLVYMALEAYEKLAESGGGIADQYTLGVIADIMVGPYQKKVRDRAREVLSRLFNAGS